MSVVSHEARHARLPAAGPRTLLGAVRAQLSFLPPAEEVALAGAHRSRSNAMAFVAGSVAVTVVLFGIAAVCASVTAPTATPEAPTVPIRLDDRAAQLAAGGTTTGNVAAGSDPSKPGATTEAGVPSFYFFGTTGPVPVRVTPAVPGSGAAPVFSVSDVLNAGNGGGGGTGGLPGGGGLPSSPTPPPVTGPGTVPVTPQPTLEPPVTQEPTPDPPVTQEPTPDPPVTQEPTPDPPVTQEPTPDPPVTQEPTPDPPVTEEPTSVADPVVEVVLDVLGVGVTVSL